MNVGRGLVLELGDPRIPQLLREAGALVMGQVGEGNNNKHVCSREMCAPQCVCIGYNLYVCAAGMLHVCSQQSCKLWTWDAQRQTCPISGIQYSSITSDYVRDDPRTWGGSGGGGGGKKVQTTQASLQSAADHIRDRASAVVKQLLYSNARVECNNAARAQNIARGKEVRARYDENQALHGQPSFWTDRYRIVGRWSTEPLPFVIYVFDQALHDYYVRIITQVWNKVDRYYVTGPAAGDAHPPPMRADIDCIAVAVLYYMRAGLKYQNVRLLPKDDFILLNLPHVNQLHFFGISKSNITHGEKIIERTFEMAIARGVPDHELALPPEQMVQLENNADVAAVASANPDADANADAVVLDSNGDRLFKLSSSKKKRKHK